METIIYQGQEVQAELISEISRDPREGYWQQDAIYRDMAGRYYLRRERHEHLFSSSVLYGRAHAQETNYRCLVHLISLNAAIHWAVAQMGNGDSWALRVDASNLLTEGHAYLAPPPFPYMSLEEWRLFGPEDEEDEDQSSDDALMEHLRLRGEETPATREKLAEFSVPLGEHAAHNLQALCRRYRVSPESVIRAKMESYLSDACHDDTLAPTLADEARRIDRTGEPADYLWCHGVDIQTPGFEGEGDEAEQEEPASAVSRRSRHRRSAANAGDIGLLAAPMPSADEEEKGGE